MRIAKSISASRDGKIRHSRAVLSIEVVTNWVPCRRTPRIKRALMATQDRKLVAGADIPQSRRVVPRSRDQAGAIRTEGRG